MNPVQEQILQQNYNKARMLYQSGNLQGAASVADYILSQHPNLVPVLHMRGRIALETGNTEEAKRILSHAVKLAPDQTPVMNDYAVALVSVGDVDRAAEMFQKLIKLQPDNPDGYRNLGLFLVTNHREEKAIPLLQKYISMVPGGGVGHSLLCTAYYYARRTEDALREYHLAIAASPDDASPYEILGLICLKENMQEEAIEAFDKAISRDPKKSSAIGNKGQALAMLGRFDAARAALKSALDIDPMALPFLSSLIELGPFQPGDDRLVYIERVKSRISELSEKDQIEIHMSLAKIADDLHQPADAMAHWKQANILCRKDIKYDEAVKLRQMKDIARVFTTQMLEKHQGLGIVSSGPVFIVGMPRSGSTLVEQILASHPQVYGAGECPNWNHWIGNGHLGADFPAHAAELPPEAWHEAAENYLKFEGNTAPDALRVTDKMPSNFLWLGALRIALPGAKFIHIHRRAEDCALSCFTKNFYGSLLYTYELTELGHYMRAYEELMAHWRKVLPPDCFMEIEYEDLVRHFDRVAHDMISFIGLEWDDACARFYETDRPVLTASMYSVRQPITGKAIGRAEAYRPWLTPFFEAYGMAAPVKTDRDPAPAA